MSAEKPAPISEKIVGVITAEFDLYPTQVAELAAGQHVAIASAVIRPDPSGGYFAVLGGLRTVPEKDHSVLVGSIGDLIDDFDDDDAN